MNAQASQDAPWGIAVASALILGLVVGIPYYGLPYFYDYFEHPVSQGGFGWSRASIMLGLPIGTLVTLIAGPLFVRRLPPRSCILSGAVVCAFALAGFGVMRGSLAEYYLLWILYMTGWTFAGPLPHQILLSRTFPRSPGSAIAIAYFGISVFGALSVACLARPLTQALGFRAALVFIGASVLLAVPIALRAFPKVAPVRPATPVQPSGEAPLNRAFWLLLIGSTISVAGVAGVTQHLKLIFREAGFVNQALLDQVFGWTIMIMLACGSFGRFAFAWGADRFAKRHVITVAFACMAAAMPLLYFLTPSSSPYLFASIFGFGMSVDFVVVPLLVADYFDAKSMPKVMGIVVPVNTVGQTWFPYLVSLLWTAFGSYSVPLLITFASILAGRFALALLPEHPPDAHPRESVREPVSASVQAAPETVS
ncbi:MFS transporter [Paludibaculum fermentans]|uniref:MFS transporter n=1 Tax=Paludibaculum fermentans TaxID=1473598 RepID=UPI003EB91F23